MIMEKVPPGSLSLSLMAMIKCPLSLYQVEVINLIFFELTPFKGSHTNIDKVII
jgi:hypothetical protein